MVIAARAATVSGGRREDAPPAARDEDHGEEKPELRLVGEKAEQHAGQRRAAIEPYQCGADQRRGEKAVVAVAEIDEHRGKRQRQEKPQRVRVLAARPALLAPAGCSSGAFVTIIRSARR